MASCTNQHNSMTKGIGANSFSLMAPIKYKQFQKLPLNDDLSIYIEKKMGFLFF
jgi:hypothetical protein